MNPSLDEAPVAALHPAPQSPAPQSPLASANHPNSAFPWSGLAEIAIDIRPNAGMGRVILEVSLKLSGEQNGAPVFVKQVEAAGLSTVSFKLHTHLLPDGPARMLLTAKQGIYIWDAAVPFHVNNSSKLGAAVRKSLQNSRTPIVFEGPCDTGFYDYSDASVRPWFDRPNALEFVEAFVASDHLTVQEVSWLVNFVERGYVVMEDCVEASLLDRIRLELDHAMSNKVNGAEPGSSKRVEHLHMVYQGIRRLWKYPPIERVLRLIFRSTPRPCQTLTYFFGSQQSAHQDTIHLTPFPAGYMCGVWVAIDDVQPDSGELEVYSGSHRLPHVYMKNVECSKVNGDWSEFGRIVQPLWQKMIQENQFERVLYRPKAGSVLIWHENLMHGGTVRVDPSRSRRSIVSHVFADGCLSFYDSSGSVGTMAPLDSAPRQHPAA
jgi:hypothetical protein